jgi:hypothetical protein
MLNLQLNPLDILSDMIPTPDSPHISPAGQPSVPLIGAGSLYSPGGGFRLTFDNNQYVRIEGVDDTTLPPGWQSGQLLSPDGAAGLPRVQWNSPIWTVKYSQAPNLIVNGQLWLVELDMQADGNLVAYYGPNVDDGFVAAGSAAIFASNTAGNPGAFLRMQDDGNLVIYGPAGVLWATGTNARPGGSRG